MKNLRQRIRALEVRAEARRLHDRINRQMGDTTGTDYLGVFDRVLDGVGVTDEQRAQAYELLLPELRALAGEPDEVAGPGRRQAPGAWRSRSSA